MKKIETEAEFESILLLEKAMVFIFAEWSGEARIAEKILTEWETKSNLEVPLFELDIDESELISKWIYEEAKDRHGYGSLVWLRSGVICGFEIAVVRCGISEIEKKTVEIFGN